MSELEISRAERLDQYVTRQLPLLSRAFAARLINDGKVRVNGVVQTKAGYKPRLGDDIVIDYEAAEQTVPDIELPVLYEDDDCVVIDKPTGVLSHSKGAYNPEATVASWLRRHLSEPAWQADPAQGRAGIVHRLDRMTSGVMIGAKHAAALSWLQKQFGQRRVKKSYQAVVSGHPSPEAAIIDVPIERNPKAPATFRAGINGKSATTAYHTLQAGSRYSLLEFKPETGRTHQLRVHARHIGHPIVGDALYGGDPADRLYLHAHTLELTLPSRERKVFESPVPGSFMKLVESNAA